MLCIDDQGQRNICRYDSANPGSCRYGSKCSFLHINSTSKPAQHRFQTSREKPLTHKKRSPVKPRNTHTAEFSTADDNDGAAAFSEVTLYRSDTETTQIETAIQQQAAKNMEINAGYDDSEDEVVYRGDNVGALRLPTTRRADSWVFCRTSLSPKFLNQLS
jgi:hypothetical protein